MLIDTHTKKKIMKIIYYNLASSEETEVGEEGGGDGRMRERNNNTTTVSHSTDMPLFRTRVCSSDQPVSLCFGVRFVVLGQSPCNIK